MKMPIRLRTLMLCVVCIITISQVQADTSLIVEPSPTLPSKSELAIKAAVADLINAKAAPLNFKFKELKTDDQDFVINTSTDSFFTIGGLDLPRSQACNLVLDLEFKDAMFRPGLFEVFWAVDPGAFGEAQKARFLISHENTGDATVFNIPLCKLYSFSGNLSEPHHQRNIVGLRFDYPMNRDVAIKFNQIKLLNRAELTDFKQTLSAEPVVLEPYERLSGSSFRSLDVVIPKVYFGIEGGLNRLSNDLPFLVFWLFLIGLFLVLIVRRFPAKLDKGQ